MKLLALSVLIIFGLNVLGEVISGHCHETSQLSLHNAASSLASDSPTVPDNDHSANGHTCHLGHCCHLVVLSRFVITAFHTPTLQWVSRPEAPIWRNLSPLFKPPLV